MEGAASLLAFDEAVTGAVITLYDRPVVDSASLATRRANTCSEVVAKM
jgi:hypothetical protein